MEQRNLKPGIFQNLKLIVQKHPEVFFKNLKDTEYYNKIRDEIIACSKKKKVKIVDAF